MEIEKILTLIDKVSASGLTEFTLEEGNLQLCMKKEKVVKICTEDTAAEQGEVFREAGKNSVASHNPANHDSEESFTKSRLLTAGRHVLSGTVSGRRSICKTGRYGDKRSDDRHH